MTSRRMAAAQGWNPLGLSIRDYAAGDTLASVTVLRGDGAAYRMPARLFFRLPRQFSALERAALRLCRGRVLDIGAGAGCHTLALQQRGLEVVALDASRAAVRVMRERGVRDPRVGNGMTVRGGPYDTLLMMMNGIAIVKSIAGLRRFLRHCRRLVAPQGQILFDSLDLRQDDLSRRFARGRKATTRRYFGEMLFRMRYKGRTGRRFQLLFIDPARLAKEAALAGWRAQVLLDEGEGRYLARLVPLAPAPRRPVRKPARTRSTQAAR
jgi:2-polyprenyl-3-methyl-5-hydroxy-6-metoxy-1,4-benzoquinol methylase